MAKKTMPPKRKTAASAGKRKDTDAGSSAAEMRIHHALAGREVVEKRMMGALVFMVDGHMCCGLTKGSLMVRVGAERREAALAQPYARPMEIGGRNMKGFVFIEPEGFEADHDLAGWIGEALAFLATLPPEKGKQAR